MGILQHTSRVFITKLPNLVQIIYSKKISSEKYMALDMIMEVKIDSGEVGGLNGQYMGGNSPGKLEVREMRKGTPPI